ncbi:MAG: hypothetical protein IJS60_00605 [Abditibacteriota bacterium]|nr:hypothetical protein [Abditibacteriota bacterium]
MRIEDENNEIDIVEALKEENEHLLNTNLELENKLSFLNEKSANHSKILIFLIVFSIIALIVIMFGIYKLSKLSSEQEFGKQTLTEQKEEINNHKQEIEDKSSQISSISEELEYSQSKIEELEEEINNLKSSIDEKDSEIEELQDKLNETQVSETNEF